MHERGHETALWGLTDYETHAARQVTWVGRIVQYQAELGSSGNLWGRKTHWAP